MTENRYITKLIKAYSDYGRIHRKPRNFSSDERPKLTLDEAKTELLRRAARIFLERYRKLGIYPEDIKDDELIKNITHLLYDVLGLCNTVISKEECEREAAKLAERIRSGSTIYSRVQKSFSDVNLGDAALNRIGKILMAALMGIQPVLAKIKGNMSLNEMLQNVLANRNKIESVEKMVGKRVEDEQDIIDYIERTVGSTLLIVYEKFHEGLSGPPSDKLTSRKVAEISYKTSKRVYNYMLRNQYVEIKTMPSNVKNSDLFKNDFKNFIIAAISHHVLANAYEELGVSRQKIVDAINQGSFEVMFVDAEGKKSYSFTEDMYITLRDVDGKDISFHLKLISISFADRNKKDGSADLDDKTGFTNFYVKLPVGLAPFEMSGMNEPVFKLQVQISPLKDQINNKAQVNLKQGTSNSYPKNKRLFNKKKKYNWM